MLTSASPQIISASSNNESEYLWIEWNKKLLVCGMSRISWKWVENELKMSERKRANRDEFETNLKRNSRMEQTNNFLWNEWTSRATLWDEAEIIWGEADGIIY